MSFGRLSLIGRAEHPAYEALDRADVWTLVSASGCLSSIPFRRKICTKVLPETTGFVSVRDTPPFRA